MSLIVNTNLLSLSTLRYAKSAQADSAIAAERLASGERINTSMDDAAGLSIVNRFIAKSASNEQGIRNATDAISVVHIAEAALDSVQDMLVRIRQLTVQAANDTVNSAAKQMLEDEAHQLMYEIDRIKDVTKFNGVTLLDGTYTSQPIYFGSENTKQDVLLSINGATTKRLFDIPDATFENGTFDNVGSATDNGDGSYSIDGWTIYTDQVDLGTDSIGGYTSPESPVYPSQATNGDTYSPSAWGGTFSAASSGSGIRLSTGNFTSDSYSVLHGPYVISDSYTEIKAGATVSFDWSAVAGSDDYDVYGYLLKDDGSTVELLDSQGRSGSGSETVTVSTAGNYKFVFVAGTFDASGGRALGASFEIDNVDISGNEPEAPYDEIIDFSSASGIATSFAKIEEASSLLLADRALLGATANRIDHSIQSLLMKGEKYAEASSRINDADYAVESANLAKSQVLINAATAMLTQANAATTNVMSLLK